MPGSASARMGLQAIAGADAANTIDNTSQALVTAIDGQTAIFSQGILASRPTSTAGTPGKTGRFYYATDTSELYYDYGTGWKRIWPDEAGSITHALLPVVPAARVYNSANISIPTGLLTALTFNSERFDTNGIHSTVTNTGRLTAQTAGLYQITGHAQWAAHSPTAIVYGLHIRLNGATLIAPQHFPLGVDSTAFAMSVSALYKLAVGDYVELCAIQSTGGAKDIAAVGNSSPEFEMAYVGRDS